MAEWIEPGSIKHQFLAYIFASGHDSSSLDLDTGLDLMLQFYEESRVLGCNVEEDQDMLLYQWGIYDWTGPEGFEIDITRQLIEGEGEDEDFSQLSLSFWYTPTERHRIIPEGNQWCHTPNDLEEFRKYIYASEAYKSVDGMKPFKIRLEVDEV